MGKVSLRNRILRERLRLEPEEITKRSGRIVINLFNLPLNFKRKNVSLYIPVKCEVETKRIISRLKAESKLFLPRFDGKKYGLCEFKSFGNLVGGPLGILQPSSGTEIPPFEIDIAILPGVAFDRHGVRLGYGKGIFDRLFAKSKAIRIGLAYDFQIVDNLPRENHDLEMDLVVCEKNVFKAT
jgi:5-formyltetrahydrofolate cyclo-ligase